MAEADDKGTWEENVEYLLSHCPHTIRVREGGGPESLMDSLIVTFMKMQDMLKPNNDKPRVTHYVDPSKRNPP